MHLPVCFAQWQPATHPCRKQRRFYCSFHLGLNGILRGYVPGSGWGLGFWLFGSRSLNLSTLGKPPRKEVEFLCFGSPDLHAPGCATGRGAFPQKFVKTMNTFRPKARCFWRLLVSPRFFHSLVEDKGGLMLRWILSSSIATQSVCLSSCGFEPSLALTVRN